MLELKALGQKKDPTKHLVGHDEETADVDSDSEIILREESFLTESQANRIAAVFCGILSLGLWLGCGLTKDHNWALCIPAGATTLCMITVICVIAKQTL